MSSALSSPSIIIGAPRDPSRPEIDVEIPLFAITMAMEIAIAITLSHIDRQDTGPPKRDNNNQKNSQVTHCGHKMDGRGAIKSLPYLCDGC